jgi:hypothetical protein
MSHICASYLSPIVDSIEREKTLRAVCSKLRELQADGFDFYAIAVSGTSGIVGAMVAARMKLDLIVVPSRSAKRHSPRHAEGVFKRGGYVIVDDLIDTGETVARMYNSICKSVATYNESLADALLWGTTNSYGTMVSRPEPVATVMYDLYERYNGQSWHAVMFDEVIKNKVPSVPLFGVK